LAGFLGCFFFIVQLRRANPEMLAHWWTWLAPQTRPCVASLDSLYNKLVMLREEENYSGIIGQQCLV